MARIKEISLQYSWRQVSKKKKQGKIIVNYIPHLPSGAAAGLLVSVPQSILYLTKRDKSKAKTQLNGYLNFHFVWLTILYRSNQEREIDCQMIMVRTSC